ncbi:hypothetical protein KBC79_00455 [Candidatus Woesebacteria bacterium]|nr:hypothetical protein [Candidatus Woesebacteria bacterium]
MTQREFNPKQSLRSLASLGVSSPSELIQHPIDPRDLDAAHREQRFGENTDNYVQALDWILESAQGKKGFLAKIFGPATGLHNSQLRRDALDFGTSRNQDQIVKTYQQIGEQLIANLPQFIDSALQDPAVDATTRTDLQSLADRLRQGDRLLNTKILADVIHARFDQARIDIHMQSNFIERLVQVAVPEVAILKNTDGVAQKLQQLDTYGLLVYTPTSSLFHCSGNPASYGAEYAHEMDAVFGLPRVIEYKGKSHEKRIDNWQSKQRNYLPGVNALSQQIASIEDCYRHSTYDARLLRQNLARVRQHIDQVLGHSLIKDMLEFSKEPMIDPKAHNATDNPNPGNLHIVWENIKAVLDFAQHSNSKQADGLLVAALNKHREILLGLLNMKDKVH